MELGALRSGYKHIPSETVHLFFPVYRIPSEATLSGLYWNTERRNAGTPERRNAGTPERRNAGTPEYWNPEYWNPEHKITKARNVWKINN